MGGSVRARNEFRLQLRVLTQLPLTFMVWKQGNFMSCRRSLWRSKQNFVYSVNPAQSKIFKNLHHEQRRKDVWGWFWCTDDQRNCKCNFFSPSDLFTLTAALCRTTFYILTGFCSQSTRNEEYMKHYHWPLQRRVSWKLFISTVREMRCPQKKQICCAELYTSHSGTPLWRHLQTWKSDATLPWCTEG